MDISQVLAIYSQEVEHQEDIIQDVTRRMLESIIEVSAEMVPHDSGALEESLVYDRHENTHIIGYGAYSATQSNKLGQHPSTYAEQVHDEPISKRTSGLPLFLEVPSMEMFMEAEALYMEALDE